MPQLNAQNPNVSEVGNRSKTKIGPDTTEQEVIIKSEIDDMDLAKLWEIPEYIMMGSS